MKQTNIQKFVTIRAIYGIIRKYYHLVCSDFRGEIFKMKLRSNQYLPDTITESFFIEIDSNEITFDRDAAILTKKNEFISKHKIKHPDFITFTVIRQNEKNHPPQLRGWVVNFLYCDFSEFLKDEEEKKFGDNEYTVSKKGLLQKLA